MSDDIGARWKPTGTKCPWCGNRILRMDWFDTYGEAQGMVECEHCDYSPDGSAPLDRFGQRRRAGDLP